jgi:predicted nucleic acid-binding protein
MLKICVFSHFFIEKGKARQTPSDVDYIVTGDKDLLVLKEYETIKIIKPKDYLEIV